MAGRLTLDTTVLIDLQRERARGDHDGPVHRFLREDLSRELQMSAVVLGEFAEGFADSGHPVLRAMRELVHLLDVDEDTAITYARITRDLRAKGLLIGTNDLWIAATALRHELLLVTSHAEHFSRVPGIELRILGPGGA